MCSHCGRACRAGHRRGTRRCGRAAFACRGEGAGKSIEWLAALRGPRGDAVAIVRHVAAGVEHTSERVVLRRASFRRSPRCMRLEFAQHATKRAPSRTTCCAQVRAVRTIEFISPSHRPHGTQSREQMRPPVAPGVAFGVSLDIHDPRVRCTVMHLASGRVRRAVRPHDVSSAESIITRSFTLFGCHHRMKKDAVGRPASSPSRRPAWSTM